MQAYIGALLESYFFYEIKRFDIKGREYLRTLGKFYIVDIGKIDNQEVDFIATTADDKLYIQVTESMQSEEIRKRELAPLQKIRDNYEKIVLSLEPGLNASYDGIKSLNLVDWLLDG